MLSSPGRAGRRSRCGGAVCRRTPGARERALDAGHALGQGVQDYADGRSLGVQVAAYFGHVAVQLGAGRLQVGGQAPVQVEHERHQYAEQADGGGDDGDSLGAQLSPTHDRRRCCDERGMESAAVAAERGAVDHAIVALLFQGGLRRSEAAALTWADVQDATDGAGILVRVRRSKTDQEGTATDVRYLKNACAAALRQLRDRTTVQRSGVRPEPTAPVLGAA